MIRPPLSALPLTAPQLAALLDEMAAQARLGIPWADALQDSEKRLRPGSLEPLADQLRQGRDVREVLAEIAGKYGSQVAAVVEAGAVSGRPAEALAGMAGLIRRRSEYRRRLVLALVYPIVISLFAAGLLIVGLLWAAGRGAAESTAALEATERNAIGLPGGWAAIGLPGGWASAWWVIPAGMVAAGIVGFLVRRQLAPWMPSRLRAIRWARLAWFAELVALALEQGIPMGEAVRLSAEASGDPGMQRAAIAWRTDEERGAEQNGAGQAKTRNAPELLVWTLRNGAASPLGFPEALRRLAGIYWYRSEQAADLWTKVLPAVLLVSVAGTLAIAFVWFVLGPIYQSFL